MQFLRKVLKRRKITFASLSQLTQVSESTLKKWFSAKDGTFGRVNLICDALGLTLNDVLLALEQRTIVTYKMHRKAQEQLLKDSLAFSVYWLMVYERQKIDHICDILGITEKVLKRQLLKLDRLNLIKLDVNEKVTLPRIIPIRWTPEGPLMEKVYRHWTKNLIEDCLQGQDKSRLFLNYLQLTDQSLSEFERELHQLEEKYLRRTIQELSTKDRNLNKVRFMGAIARGRYPIRDELLKI